MSDTAPAASSRRRSSCSMAPSLPARLPLHHLRARLAEAELAVERVHVGRVQEPACVSERAVLDHLAHELLPQPTAAVLLEDVHVREVDERSAVRRRAAEADLTVAVVEPDDARGAVDQAILCLARPARRPVAHLAEEAVLLVPVDAPLVVVQLEPVADRAPHAIRRSLTRRASGAGTHRAPRTTT